jgi:LysR family transcriptional regulator, glycine cleavage system transcriptional activator
MRIPPLTALRTFECAGRKLSFTQAASELSVTPGAVSRQIRVLEDFLSVQLFHRANREVGLTKEGKEYLSRITDAFALIKSATDDLMDVPEGAPLRVSTSSTFTLRWLMPRMNSFYARNPKNNLQLSMNLAAVDFQRDDLDATIKLGHEDTPQSVVRKLFDADLVAVCSPRLLERQGELKEIGDLAKLTLLHSTARPNNWNLWLSAAGMPNFTNRNVMYFESSSLAYQAAAEGVGVAIAQLPLVLDDLESGNLVMPFPIAAPDDEVYNLIWPDRTPRNPSFRPFRDWMLDEAQKTSVRVGKVLAAINERRQGRNFAKVA